MVAITKELSCAFGDFFVGWLVCFVGFEGIFLLLWYFPWQFSPLCLPKWWYLHDFLVSSVACYCIAFNLACLIALPCLLTLSAWQRGHSHTQTSLFCFSLWNCEVLTMWLICILSQSQRQQLVVTLESWKWFWNYFHPLQSLNFIQWYLLVTNSMNQGSECVWKGQQILVLGMINHCN